MRVSRGGGWFRIKDDDSDITKILDVVQPLNLRRFMGWIIFVSFGESWVLDASMLHTHPQVMVVTT